MNDNENNKPTATSDEINKIFHETVKEKFTAYAAMAESDPNVIPLDTLYEKPEYLAEKRYIKNLTADGLSAGMGAALASFVLMRVGGSAAIRHWGRRAFSRGSDLGLSSSNVAGTSSTVPIVKKPGLFFRAARLCAEVAASIFVGATVRKNFPESSIRWKWSEVPLVEGRSVLSEQLCGDFSAVLNRYSRRTWDPDHPTLIGTNGTSGPVASDSEIDGINMLEGFVANCKRRALYEERLRKEQGLKEDEAVVVPSPGVPRDISISFDDLFDD
ncbi:hypothetical protein ACHAXS_005754 [Conticribra weissflogii]